MSRPQLRCEADLKPIIPGRAITDLAGRAYCNESCYAIWLHRHGPQYLVAQMHRRPDPKHHRKGDGWRSVKHWVRGKVSFAK